MKKDADYFSQILLILEQERSALLRADFEELSAISEKKAIIIEELRSRRDANPDDMQALKTEVLRNEVLFEQSLAGIRAVGDRIAELQRVRENLDTYDRRGQKKTIRNSKHSFERRA